MSSTRFDMLSISTGFRKGARTPLPRVVLARSAVGGETLADEASALLSFTHGTINQEQFIAASFQRFDFQAAGFVKRPDAFSIGEGRRVASAKNQRAECVVDFIHQPGPEQRSVDLSPSFAQEPFYFPFFTQPFEGCPEIELLLAEN